MKTINNFIVERLKYSKFPINEKLKISSRSNINIYTCHPKNIKELKEIIKKRLAKDKNANLNDIDVSEIDNMFNLFWNLDPHNIDISEWDVSNVTDMGGMFGRCRYFNCDLSNWDVSKVINMNSMFNGCKKFTGKGLENWKTFNLQAISYMFYNCEKFDCDLSNWDVSKIKTDMYFTFDGCESLKNIPSWYKYKC